MKACGICMEKNKPYFVVILVQLIYAGMALFSKSAIVGGMDPCVFVFYRQLFATIVLTPFAFFLERNNKAAQLSLNLLFKIFLVSLFGITLSLNIYSFALKYTSATFAAATTNTIPAITFVMAVILRMESISIKEWHGVAKVMGTVVGISGAFVYAFVKGPPLSWSSIHQKDISPSSHLNTSKDDWVKGSLAMVLANTVWSLWLIMQANVLREYPSKVRLTTLQCFFSCTQSAVWAIAMQRNISSWKLGWDINLLSVAYCGVVVTGFNYWLQLWAIEKKGPVFTAMFTPLALIITAIFSALLWKEILHLGSFCGALLLAFGLFAVLWGKDREVLLDTRQNEVKSPQADQIKLEYITCTSLTDDDKK